MLIGPETLIEIAIGIFGMFLVLSIIDGVFLHLVWFRLPENPDSRFEHILHTVRAVLFVPSVYLLFFKNVSGELLWIAAGLVIVDFSFQSVDILEERRSRLRIGGLRSGEYLLHVTESSLHFIAYALVFAGKPVEAWSRNVALPEYPEAVKVWALVFVVGGIAIAAVHLALIRYPFLVSKIIGARFR